jgi:hypothetical protein
VELKSEHWTAGSIENFTYRIAADFLSQVETKIENGEISRAELAQRLSRTPGRVSQLLNNPGNLTVTSAVRLVRAAGMKVALVAYEDNDPDNNNGPVNSAIFNQCWKNMGAPTTFFEVVNTATSLGNCFNAYVVNGNNLTVVNGSNMTITTTGPIPINASPLWAAHTGVTNGNANVSSSTPTPFPYQSQSAIGYAANIETSIEPTAFMTSAATN